MLGWVWGLLPLLAHLVSAQPESVFVSVPNMVRVGNDETILINVFSERVLPVTVELKNMNGEAIADPKTVDVSQATPTIAHLFVEPMNVHVLEPLDENMKTYAKVVVRCPLINFVEEKDVLISFEEGYVFIQTDKPIYTPDQSVSIRIVILDQTLRCSNQKVQLDVLSPQGVIVHRIPETQAPNGFMTHIFRFPHQPLFGNWSVVASYGLGMRFNRSVQFEVKEYVLPTFSVMLETPDHLLPSDQAMEVVIKAMYVYGHPVQGDFYAKVGVIEFDGEITIKKTIAGQIIHTGHGHFQVPTADLEPDGDWFAENKGKRLYIEVSVLEGATGLSENVSDSSCMFVESPYKFRLDRTVRYYKKGLPYVLKVDLFKTNGKPAAGIPVSVVAMSQNSDNVERQLLRDREANDELDTTNDKGQLSVSLYVPEDSASINILVKTEVPALVLPGGVDHNANYSFGLEPHISPSVNDFLVIRLPNEIVPVDRNLPLELTIETDDQVLFVAYYVVSKGIISEPGLIGDGVNPIVRTDGFNVRIGYDMAPSARIVAFYINQQGQVISDSLWIEIQKRCENGITVSVKLDEVTLRNPILEPDLNVVLQVDALPGTTVGLLAVDKAVYLLRDYHRLTSDKMFTTMDSHDVGCGPGGGRDSPDTFKNAGIMVLSNANLEVERRDVYGCPTPTNRRRRRNIPDHLWEPFEHYQRRGGQTELACRRGLRLLNAALTCEDRSRQFATRLDSDLAQEERAELLQIFMECCIHAETARTDANRGRSGGAGGPGDVDLIQNYAEPTMIRSDFKETWIFEEILINNNQGFKQQEFTIPSSITEWSVSAVGVSPTHAMCIADEMDVLVRKDFFAQLHLPYAVVRREQVEIVVAIFNYLREAVNVVVRIKTTDKICTEGNPNQFSGAKRITIRGNSAGSVKYVLMGLEIGEHPVIIHANASSTTGQRYYGDALKRILRVIPEGIETSYSYSPALDPSGTLIDENVPLGNQPVVRVARNELRTEEVRLVGEETQINFIDIRLPSSAVPNSEKCEVSVIGDILGPVVTSIIDGLESLLTVPRGCGEQTMIYMAPNVYVLQYLQKVEQTTPEFEVTAKNNIRQGVIQEMTHRRADGSYSVWGTNPRYPSSTWLTAFVNKVFCAASQFEGVFVDPKVVCQAMEWLITNAQREDGAFVELYKVHHREMTGGVQGDATLTSFVLISLHECECPSLGSRLLESTNRATQFLSGQLNNVNRIYSRAIMTYALALVQSPVAQQANLILKSSETFDPETGKRHWEADGSSITSGTKPYWYQVRPSAISVEATGYALLAQLALRDTSYSAPIVKWLSEQQNYGGGFASTQDTVVALQALSEYASLNRGGGGDMSMVCTVKHDDRRVEEFHFDETNALVQRHTTTPAWGVLEVNSTGNGIGKLNVKVTYNTMSEDLNERECPFKILINAREARAGELADGAEEPPARRGDQGRSRIGRLEKRQANREPDRGQLIVRISIEVGYEHNTATNMGIIDVGLYSGFVPIKADLEQIKESNDYIRHYEVSQRSVIFYADEIPPVDQLPKLKLEFNARREYIVGNIQPVAVKVYDYYDPTKECVRFYHPTSESETAHLLANICEGNLCVCAAGDCLDCEPKTKEVLLRETCASAQTYAYRVRITSLPVEHAGFNVFEAEVGDVLKNADDDITHADATREFWVSTTCGGCVDSLRLNSWYLIIGKTVLPYETKEGHHSFKYILGSSSFMEFWPERRRKKTREQFIKMEAFREDMDAGRNDCH